MNIAEQFKADLEANFLELQEDEWAFTRYREEIVKDLQPYEAHQNILPLIELGARLAEQHALVECCWLVMALIHKSQTTEISGTLEASIFALARNAERHECKSEVEPIIKWYRLENKHT